MNHRPIVVLLLFVFLLISGCQNTTKDQPDASSETPSAIIGPGSQEETQYVNEHLDLTLPLIDTWSRGDHRLVEQAFRAWDPQSGLDSLPSMFLLTTGDKDTSRNSTIETNYFLQIESASAYPGFGNDPAIYLSEVGNILVNAGQTIRDSVHTTTLDQREVQRMDIGFMFGDTEGKQVYYSWEDDGLFVNLVFTYESYEEWELLSSSVLNNIHLE